MFDVDFYPTPVGLVEKMVGLLDIDISNQVVLEPHGGSGNIINVLKSFGSHVLSCEKNEQLAEITKSCCDEFLCNDFLQVKKEDVSHVKAIIGNPPFSTIEKHVNHIWEIAPGGCRIALIIPNNLIKNTYSQDRIKLKELLTSGIVEDVSNAFSNAERKTDVECSIVVVFKPLEDCNDFDSDLFSVDLDEIGNDEGGLMPHNEITGLVSAYSYAVKQYIEYQEVEQKMSNALKTHKTSIKLGMHITNGNYEVQVNSVEQFKRILQKDFWEIAFNKLNMEKYITNGVRSDLNAFINQQKNYPFSVRNIFTMCNILYQTKGQIANKAIAEVFDNLTMHTHENRYNIEGWKTNDEFMVNKKFIYKRYFSDWDLRNGTISFLAHEKGIDDIFKAIAVVLNLDYNKILSFNKLCSARNVKVKLVDHNGREYEREERDYSHVPYFGDKFETEFFWCRVYKKGTIHFEFKDEAVWVLFNKIAIEYKGWKVTLPNTTKHNSKKTKNTWK